MRSFKLLRASAHFLLGLCFTLSNVSHAVEVGQSAPNIAWRNGEAVEHLQAWAGRYVLLDFWATWCAPCRVSLPWLAEMQRKYASAGLQVLPINLDKASVDAAAFLSRQGVSLPVLRDPQGLAAQAFDVQAMPSSYLISPNGRVLRVHRGFTADGALAWEAAIRAHVLASQ